MAKTQYKYNPNTLNFEKVQVSKWQILYRLSGYLAMGLVFAFFSIWIFTEFFDSPEEKRLKMENGFYADRYDQLTRRVNDLESVLKDMEYRDDNIYRVIFEAEPIDKNERLSAVGGVNRYKHLEGFDFSDLVIDTEKRIDNLGKRMVVQSKSLDEVKDLALSKEEMLSCIPAIQPVSNKDLKRMASGYGMRIDPHYKTPAFHAGMDFTAPTGTPIYATGDGVVTRADNKSSGYGNHVRIDHGFGYVTLYAHMSEWSVSPGQKVKRGDIIGLVGNTGKSKGPHLHYEVRKNGEAINPINFYFNDLSPEEYDIMIELAGNANQALD